MPREVYSVPDLSREKAEEFVRWRSEPAMAFGTCGDYGANPDLPFEEQVAQYDRELMEYNRSRPYRHGGKAL